LFQKEKGEKKKKSEESGKTKDGYNWRDPGGK